jgi:hypothetical protein
LGEIEARVADIEQRLPLPTTNERRVAGLPWWVFAGLLVFGALWLFKSYKESYEMTTRTHPEKWERERGLEASNIALKIELKAEQDKVAWLGTLLATQKPAGTDVLNALDEIRATIDRVAIVLDPGHTSGKHTR